MRHRSELVSACLWECWGEHWLLTWPSEQQTSKTALPCPITAAGQHFPTVVYPLCSWKTQRSFVNVCCCCSSLLTTAPMISSLMLNLLHFLTGILWNSEHDEAGFPQAHRPPPWSLCPGCRRWVQLTSLRTDFEAAGSGKDRAAIQFRASLEGDVVDFSGQTEVEWEQPSSCQVLFTNKFSLPLLSLNKCVTGWFLEVRKPSADSGVNMN